ncbi:WD40-repeat-containing domain protein [Gamsiella multidivaricata]|uniref:WD40-repeat-containing domain protein n=1 Tax=Gamsiella multidivaricata TaxID=101098 RepID=UPI00221E9C24|nr:WD40-repeat-containing domain protein [Gamsiella multidivaricata]KAI7820316.1 WD40-repeat-containing domain protein [Gamsiella multidivaricata]
MAEGRFTARGYATPKNKPNNNDDLKPKEKSEVELENLIFGDNEDLIGETLSRAGHELSSDEEGDALDEFDYDAEEEVDAGGQDMFFMDTGPTPVMREEIDEDEQDDKDEDEDEDMDKDQEESNASEDEGSNIDRLSGKPAWVDEDDKTLSISLKSVNRLKKLRKEEAEDIVNGVDYEQRLRRQFEKVYPVPNWALPEGSRKRRRRGAGAGAGSDSDEYSDEELEQEDNSILTTSKGFLEKSTRLRIMSPESIVVTRVKNANQMGYSKSVIQSVEFHPNGQMLLTAGFDRTLRLFQIDGKLNQMMQSVFYKDMPVYMAAFSASGNAVVASGRRKYFYTYDIEAGKVDKSDGIYGRKEKSLEKFSLSPCGRWIAFMGRDGYIILVSSSTKQWVKNMKMNGNVRAVAWSSDSTYLYSVGGDAEIYQWEISSGKCLHRFLDEGGFKPTCIAISPNDQFWAVGSKSGIVNVYDRTCLTTYKPKSLRAIGNLTTSIHTMRFNHDSQILAISSKARKDQLRLVHIPSLKVFPNWPTSGTPLSYVTCLTFSPRSGYLAIGNDKGKVLLYRLNHYPSA